MNLPVVSYKHMMMIDTAYHVIFSFNGEVGHVRMPMGHILTQLTVSDTPEADPLQVEIEKLIGQPCTLQNLTPDWANIKGEDGLIEHPFTGVRMKLKDVNLTYSNFFNNKWRRWFPTEVENKVCDLLGQLAELDATRKYVQTRLNLLTDKDYSDEKLKS